MTYEVITMGKMGLTRLSTNVVLVGSRKVQYIGIATNSTVGCCNSGREKVILFASSTRYDRGSSGKQMKNLGQRLREQEFFATRQKIAGQQFMKQCQMTVIPTKQTQTKKSPMTGKIR